MTPPTENDDATPLALEVRGARKTFGFVTALGGVDLLLRRGEILALLGDNGAGKSTLIKSISGIHQLDEGQILLDGKELRLKSASEARAHGIETVFQDLAVFDNLDVSANFLMGREKPRPAWLGPLGFLSNRDEVKQWNEHAGELSVKSVSAKQEIGLMSGGQRQAVAVARAVAFASKVIILDEPTAALGVRESRQVLDLVKRLPGRGISVILISHNMEQVVEVADRAVVLRQGRSVGTMDVTPGAVPDLIAMIMGAPVPARTATATTPARGGPEEALA